MDIVGNQWSQRLVHQPVAGQHRQAPELLRQDAHAIVPGATRGTGVAGMLGAVVDDLEVQRLERVREQLADLREPVVHGLTFRKGRTSTAANTPSVTYGSASAHARASASEPNSATIRLPVKPAGPGSGASIAGSGPLSTSRPAASSASRRARCAGRAARRRGREPAVSVPMIAYSTSAPAVLDALGEPEAAREGVQDGEADRGQLPLRPRQRADVVDEHEVDGGDHERDSA